MSDQEAEQLFKDQADNQSPLDSYQSDPEVIANKKKTKNKKNKNKNKSINKQKKKTKQLKKFESSDQYEDQRDEEKLYMNQNIQQFKDLIDVQASQDSQDEEQMNSSAEIQGQNDRKYYEQLYGVKDQRPTERLLKKLQNKDDRQINQIYQNKANQMRQSSSIARSKSDPNIYMLNCQKQCEDELVLSILNKAQYCANNSEKYYCNISSVFSSKKRFPGKIFVEADNEKEVKDSLVGFVKLNLNTIKEVQYQYYSVVFEPKILKKPLFEINQFVRIKHGLYAHDLGRIHKIYKHKADVILVPRVNIKLINQKMREQQKNTPQNQLILKKNEILKRYTGTKMCFPNLKSRPNKNILSTDVFHIYDDLPHNKKITLTQQGLITLSFALNQIDKPSGTILPIQLQPFSKNKNVFEQFQIQEGTQITVKTPLKLGDSVNIAVGQLKGCFGKIKECDPDKVIINCENKELKGLDIIELPEHLQKRFKEGQRVVVIEGNSKGIEGLILKQQNQNLILWTDNNNQITVSKMNVQLRSVSIYSTQNPLELNKQDLIKTTQRNIGIVLTTSKDSICMLDINNTIVIINNIDYHSKIVSYNLVAITKNEEILKRQTQVKIASGVRKGLVCLVKRVYQNYIFLQNKQLRKSQGFCIQNADNCLIVTQRADYTQFRNQRKNGCGDQSQFKIGKSFIIRFGCLKGYKGIIKKVNKQQVEISIPQKNISEWYSKSQLKSKGQLKCKDNDSTHSLTPEDSSFKQMTLEYRRQH